MNESASMKVLLRSICLLTVFISSGCVYYPERFRPEPLIAKDRLQGSSLYIYRDDVVASVSAEDESDRFSVGFSVNRMQGEKTVELADFYIEDAVSGKKWQPIRIRNAVVNHGRLAFVENSEPLKQGHYIRVDFDKEIGNFEHIKVNIGIEDWNIGEVVFNRRRKLESICC